MGITILTVYLTGINYNRSLTSNLYLSLGIIATSLFLFMAYGLYKGIGLIDNFPKFRNFKRGDIMGNASPTFDTPSIDIGDGIGGLILILLEAALDLKINKTMIFSSIKAFFSATLGLIGTAIAGAYILQYFSHNLSFLAALFYATPLAILSSAIIIHFV